MHTMVRIKYVIGLVFLFTSLTACTKKIPQVDLSQVDQAFLQRCTDEVGVIIGIDERFNDYWNRDYDNSVYRVLGGPQTPLMRRVMKIMSEKGIEAASFFSVIHYRERIPEVEVNVWMKDGSIRPVNVTKKGTVALADWPCELFFPRQTKFKISTLVVGDTVEIKAPISGPDKLVWHFGSHKFCALKSNVAFGHSTDDNRPDLRAISFDASGGVARTSQGDAYPMTFALQKPLMPISKARLPYVLTAFRCPGWNNLRGQLLQTTIWLARKDEVAGRNMVNPLLVKPVENGETKRRIQATANWLAQRVRVDPVDVPLWLRWMPLKPAHKTALQRKGGSGDVAALTFRILEEAGLKPRLALVHTHPRNAFYKDLPTLTQFDSLAVLVDDEDGKTHWLVPGLPYDPEDQPPAKIRGRQALVLERWWIDRVQGAGICKPVATLAFSCQMSTPEPVEFKLITVGN